MGTLSCQRCGAKSEASSQKEADDLIDHSVGKMIGRPCSGLESDLKWSGSRTTVKVEAPKPTETSESPKKKSTKSKKG